MSRYQPGLSNISESIFSDHYLVRNCGKLNIIDHENDIALDHRILNEQEFEVFMLSILNASKDHIQWSFDRISRRVDDKLITCSDIVKVCISEVLKDRQFTKASKNNIDWDLIKENIEECLSQSRDIQCVIVGLPFKMPTIVKCESCLADFGEAGFLLQLYEFCQVFELLIKKYINPNWNMRVKFLVVTDGLRFKDMIGIEDLEINSYQQSIKQWISWLSIGEYVEIFDYIELISNNLSTHRLIEKKMTRNQVYNEYQGKMANNINIDNMYSELASAKICDPDIESKNLTGRFVSLFQSILFTMRYKCFSKLNLSHRSKEAFYLSCIKQIIDLIKQEQVSTKIEQNINHMVNSMLAEAWEATIQYISEIRSDRDSSSDIIQECIPVSLRWTIHAKKGQICLTTRSLSGINLLPWHGVSMFRKSGIKIKNYTVPFKMIDIKKATKLSVNINNVLIPITYIESSDILKLDFFENMNQFYSRRANG